DWSRRSASAKRTPSARSKATVVASSAPVELTRSLTTSLLDLDGLATPVVAAIGADTMGELGLMALGAGGVRRGLRLPVGTPLGPPGLGLSPLRYRHRSFLSRLSRPTGRGTAARARPTVARRPPRSTCTRPCCRRQRNAGPATATLAGTDGRAAPTAGRR